MNQSELPIENSKLFYMYVHFFVGRRDSKKLILIDTQGSLTHDAEIFKFGDVSGPRVTK